jgi:hypothetical protein
MMQGQWCSQQYAVPTHSDQGLTSVKVILVVMGVAGGCALKHGILNITQETPLNNRIALGHLNNTVLFLYIPAVAFAKLSILLQMIRIFAPIRGTKAWYTMMAFTVVHMVYYFGDFVAQFITCFPRSKRMGHLLPGMCPVSTKVAVTGAVNTTSDFCMLAIPIFRIARLQMPTAKKVVACAVFTVGSLCVTCLYH